MTALRGLARELAVLAGSIGVAVVIAALAEPVAVRFEVPAADYRVGVVPTLVGIAAGVPIAWWVIRLGERIVGAREAAAARVRRLLVLRLIVSELKRNHAEMRGDRAVRTGGVIIPFLAVETWDALADGGELRWIDDPQLIADIANAYHRIRATIYLERLQLESTRAPIIAEAARALDDQHRHTVAAIDIAVNRIDAAIVAIEPAR